MHNYILEQIEQEDGANTCRAKWPPHAQARLVIHSLARSLADFNIAKAIGAALCVVVATGAAVNLRITRA